MFDSARFFEPLVLPENRSVRATGRIVWNGLVTCLVDTSVWLGAALASLSVFSAHVLGLPIDGRVPALVLLSTVFIYNLDHHADARFEAGTLPADRRLHAHPAMLLMLVGAALATGVLVGRAPADAQVVFAVYCTSGLVYSIPAVPWWRSGRLRFARLKDIAGLKSWLVAASITCATVGLPVAWAGRPFDSAVWDLAVFVFAYLACNTHMFDVRDLHADLESGIGTLPSRVGVARTKSLLVLLCLVVLAMLSWGWQGSVTAAHPEVLLCFMAAIAWIRFADVGTNRRVFSVLIDGALFLPAVLIALHDVVE